MHGVGVGGLIQPLSDLLLTGPSLPADGNWLLMLSVSPCTLVKLIVKLDLAVVNKELQICLMISLTNLF